MKKLFALILAIALMAAMSVTIFAADSTLSYSDSDQTSGLSVTYNVEPSFTVTIPPTVGLGNSVEVAAEGVVVEYGKSVNVKIAGTGESDDSFKLRTAEGAVLDYTVLQNGNPVQVGDTILSVTPTSDVFSTQLSFIAPTSILYAGTYTGTITFTIVVE